jgi:hypothetical protein
MATRYEASPFKGEAIERLALFDLGSKVEEADVGRWPLAGL